MGTVGGTTTSVAPDPVLTALAVELGTGGEGIANRIAPIATVLRDDFKYAKWGREEIKDDVHSKRAIGVGANEVKFSKTFVASSVEYYSLNDRIADEIRNNDPNPGELNRRSIKVLTGKIMLGVEKRVAAFLEAASKTQAAPSTKWDAASGATIRKDVLNARETFRRNAGMYPNAFVIPPAVSTVVFNDDKIVDLIKHTSGTLVEDGIIKKFLNMDVIVPGYTEDTSNPGATANIADIYNSDEAYYLYVNPQAGNDLRAQTALRQVRSLASSGSQLTAREWRDPDVSANCDLTNVQLNQKELVIADELMLRHLDLLT